MEPFKLFATAGSPILHSLSPDLFNPLFARDNLPYIYTRIVAATPEEAIQFYRNLPLQGMNITTPLKTGMVKYLDTLDPAAKDLGAVNTVVAEDGGLKGYNTDPDGVVQSLKRRILNLKGVRCVVLGAGAAGRAAVHGLVREGAEVTLINRTDGKAEEVSHRLGCSWGRWKNLGDVFSRAEVLVSAVSSAETFIPEDCLNPGIVVLEADYKNAPLAAMARRRGCLYIGGEEWLLHQAIPAFKLFTGREGDEDSLWAALSQTADRKTPKPNLALIGFMGCGKTSVGRGLAQKMNLPFVDTDQSIETEEGVSVSEIFRQRGERRFRQMESETLSCLGKQSGMVLSCGGGCVENADNRTVLANFSLVVWLWAPLGICLQRIIPGSRPLLAGADPLEKAAELLKKRIPVYAETAAMVVSAERDVKEIVEALYAEIGPALGR